MAHEQHHEGPPSFVFDGHAVSDPDAVGEKAELLSQMVAQYAQDAQVDQTHLFDEIPDRNAMHSAKISACAMSTARFFVGRDRRGSHHRLS